MPKPSKLKTEFLAKLKPDCFYHIYNRTNNREALFLDDGDRMFFLKQYKRFAAPYVDTCVYCLLPNHFHLMIRIKSAAVLLELTAQTPEPQRTAPQRKILTQQEEERDFHPLVERQFTRMFAAYALYFNQRYQRSGNLFYRPFKRVAVDDDIHLQWLVYYIHHNPRKHGITENFMHYPWSSYPSLISKQPTALVREVVWDLFGSREFFVAFHEGKEPQCPEDWNWEIEDE